MRIIEAPNSPHSFCQCKHRRSQHNDHGCCLVLKCPCIEFSFHPQIIGIDYGPEPGHEDQVFVPPPDPTAKPYYPSRPVFSLCHSTARLQNGIWYEAFLKWLESCDNTDLVEYIVSVDARDVKNGMILGPSDSETYTDFLFYFSSFKTVTNFGPQTAVAGWNTAAAASTGLFLITVADDYFPPPHWDTELLKCIPSLDSECVLDVDNSDGSYPLLPFSFLTRRYYEKLGYLFYPEYIGMLADNDFTNTARLDGVVLNARHLKFQHLHPEHGTAPIDDIYRRQHRNEAWKVGREVYKRRQKPNWMWQEK